MPTKVTNIHDAFFKRALSDPELAGSFLREHLPPEVADLLGPEPPEPVPGSFVDEQLRQHYADLLFRVRLNTGDSAFAYVLLEHKSSPDQGARLQLLRYVVRVLADWYDQNKQQLPLPPVLPLLAHQGPERWTFSCEFTDLFGTVPEPLRPYLPSFRHELVDLPRIDDRQLSHQARLRAFLKALKYHRHPDLADHMHLVLSEVPALREADLLVMLTYLDKRPGALNSTVLREILNRLFPERKEQVMGWLIDPFVKSCFEDGTAEPYVRRYLERTQKEATAKIRAEGIAEGIAEGKAEGKAEGEARVLTRFLEKRFGIVPNAIREQISTAEISAIEAWVERAVDAPNLQSVFEPN